MFPLQGVNLANIVKDLSLYTSAGGEGGEPAKHPVVAAVEHLKKECDKQPVDNKAVQVLVFATVFSDRMLFRFGVEIFSRSNVCSSSFRTQLETSKLNVIPTWQGAAWPGKTTRIPVCWRPARSSRPMQILCGVFFPLSVHCVTGNQICWTKKGSRGIVMQFALQMRTVLVLTFVNC